MTYGRNLMSARTEDDASGVDTGAREPTRAEAAEALEAAGALLGRRWKLGILCLLSRGRYRYNAMMRELPGATPKMLTQQLRSLEEEGLVVRYEYVGGAKHTEYALTPVGEDLVPVVEALSAWVSRHWGRPAARCRDREANAGVHGVGRLTGSGGRAD